MSRAQCIVHRGAKVLLVKHRHEGCEWWCLPGGGIIDSESPTEAALRELAEECQVSGQIARQTSVVTYGPGDQHFTFLAEIGDQQPRLGHDPELAGSAPILVDCRWLDLTEVPERDRAFLWTAGLLTVEPFADLVLAWSDAVSYPADNRNRPPGSRSGLPSCDRVT
ncbi:MAG: NUDIX hydrolase [Candidatus Latescibacterota bacterium]|jgi:ADP-ribose pyrophosphatase YjhB (NUDIX family)